MRLAFAYVLASLVVSAQENVPSTDPLRSDDACMASDGPGCSTELLQAKKAAEKVLLSQSQKDSTEDQVNSGCGELSFRPDDILPKSSSKEDLENAPVPPGTKDNMEPFPIDFSGVWWISWTGKSAWWFPEWLYSWLGVEVGWTWAGLRSNMTADDRSFPARVYVPTNLKRHWMYTSHIGGRIGMYGGAGRNPKQELRMTFFNETFGQIDTPGSYCPSALTPSFLSWMIPPKLRGPMTWPFQKIDDDTWLRPTVCGETAMATYTLKRIIFEDGKPNPEYWKHFLNQFDWMPWHVRNFGTDNTCVRKCNTLRDVIWLPEWTGQLKMNCDECLKKCNNEQ